MSTRKVASKPMPLNSIVASAKRISKKEIVGRKIVPKEWQKDAWDIYDLVGEQRFLATTLANRIGQARMFVGRLPNALTAEPEEIVATEEVQGDAGDADISADASDTQTEVGDVPAEVLVNILESFGGTPAGRAQIMARMGLNLFVAGDGWLAGIPKAMLEPDEEDTDPLGRVIDGDINDGASPLDGEIDLDELTWRMLSVSEVKTIASGEVELSLEEGEALRVDPEDIFLFRVWRPHPNQSWAADSPTRSSLPVLRELVGLTMYVSAIIDSRLAGSGIFFVPQSAQTAIRVAAGLPETPGDDEEDPFTEALMEAMLTPIKDRSSASSVVPLMVAVPDESIEKFRHLSFAGPLDEEARNERDHAIRRLALGQDAPPELLLGTAGMNHWGAWLVQEDVVTTHIEPPLSLICDALTTQYLWPVLESMGYEKDIVRQYVIWYDVEHMIIRPNRSADAQKLFDAGALSATSLRSAAGFDETDAPPGEVKPEDEEDSSDEELRKAAGMKAIDMAITNPQLVIDPGLQAIAQQVYDVLSGNFSEEDSEEAEPEPVPPALAEANAAPPEEEEDTGAIPATADDEAVPPGLNASGVPPVTIDYTMLDRDHPVFKEAVRAGLHP